MSQELTKLRYNRVPFHTADGDAVLQRVEAHWETMRSSGPVPTHMSMIPETLDDALSHCFVLERVGATIARFRVAGQALSQIIGMEARGMPISAFFTAEGRDTLGPLINNCCEGPEIIEIPLTAQRGLTRSALRGRLILLPLKDQDGQVSRIFGAIVLDAAPGRRAVRFDVDHLVPLRCKRLTPLSKSLADMKTQIAVARSAEPTHQRATPSPQTRAHLRLVVDNT